MRWSIHLMVRIQDSQSWHRGSIPLSTTKRASENSGAFFVVTVSNRDMYTFVVGCVETDGADTNLFNELRVFLNEMVTVSSVDSFFLEHKKEHPISRMLL